MEFDIMRLEDFAQQSVIGNQVHRHNYYMLQWITGGTGVQLIDSKRYPLEKDRIYAMYPGQLHAIENQADLSGYVIFFTAHFYHLRYHARQLSEFFFLQPQAVAPFVRLAPDHPSASSMASLWQLMLEECHGRQLDSVKALRSFLDIVLIAYARLYEEQYAAQNQKIAISTELLLKFQKLIEGEFSRKHKVRDYAELLDITPNYLNALCQKHTGKQAGTLIRERIMLEAKRLLAHEEFPVIKIGQMLGFEDSSYFSRFFSRYEGQTPERFRRQFRQFDVLE